MHNASRNAQQQRRLPPYAKDMIARLRVPSSFKNFIGTSGDGRHPVLWVGIGPNALAWASRNLDKRLVTICPYGEPPKQYRWDFLCGHDPIFLLSCGSVTDEEVRVHVAAMMRDGVQRIIHGGGRLVTPYVAR